MIEIKNIEKHFGDNHVLKDMTYTSLNKEKQILLLGRVAREKLLC